MAGPGHIFVFEQNPSMIRARLSNFDLSQARLKPEHENWLTQHALGFLHRGGSLRVIGLASRSGDPGFNLRLSRRRADAVVHFLRAREHKSFKVALNEALGEDAARIAHLPNGNDDERWRSVIVSVWDRPDPPPMPPPVLSTQPQMVERPVYVRIIAREEVRSGMMDEHDRVGEVMTHLGNTAAQHMGLAQRVVDRRTARIPDNQQLQEIRLARQRENVGAGGFFRAEIRMEYCDITYVWGHGNGQIRLVDQFDSQSSATRMIARAAAQLWLERPATALHNRRVG